MKIDKLPEKSLFPIIETHAHLDYLDDENIQTVLTTSNNVGVNKIITVAVSPDNQNKVLEIAQKYENVWCTQGIHPHEAKLYDKITEDLIKENAQNSKVVAIGEIGLDYHYDNSPRDKQREVFEKQLQLSIDLELPIVIHTREAEEDTENILKNFQSALKYGCEIHCFSSNMKLAEYALSHNYYLGFNGVVTFKPADNVRDVLKITPIDQILLETDCPYLTPVPVRGRKNAPFYLPYIAKYICEFLEQREEDLIPIIYKNSRKLFKL